MISKLCKQNKIKKFIHISALGVSKIHLVITPEMLILRRKYKKEFQNQ